MSLGSGVLSQGQRARKKAVSRGVPLATALQAASRTVESWTQDAGPKTQTWTQGPAFANTPTVGRLIEPIDIVT